MRKENQTETGVVNEVISEYLLFPPHCHFFSSWDPMLEGLED
jgi:hypothetical protein